MIFMDVFEDLFNNMVLREVRGSVLVLFRLQGGPILLGDVYLA